MEPFAGFPRGTVLDRPAIWWGQDEARDRRSLPIEAVIEAGLGALDTENRRTPNVRSKRSRAA